MGEAVRECGCEGGCACVFVQRMQWYGRRLEEEDEEREEEQLRYSSINGRWWARAG